MKLFLKLLLFGTAAHVNNVAHEFLVLFMMYNYAGNFLMDATVETCFISDFKLCTILSDIILKYASILSRPATNTEYIKMYENYFRKMKCS